MLEIDETQSNGVSLKRERPRTNDRDVPEYKQIKMENIRNISLYGVVQIFVTRKDEWRVKPWVSLGSSQSTGTGFLISNRIIVTNCHVVENGKNIQVKRQFEGNKYKVRVLAVVTDVDLALITVDDDKFWSRSMELEITDGMIRQQDEVDIIGYPIGGETVCITNGVVSRIDWHGYAHSGYSNLCVTVDAAINAGNSGGPAIHNGKVVGVAFQGLKEADGIGYIIPASILLIVLREFLRKLTELIPAPSTRSEASSVTGSESPSKCGPAPAVVESALGKSVSLSTGALVPYLPSEQVKLPDFGHFDALIMKLENPSLRSFYTLPEGSSGVLITKVKEHSWLHGSLQKGDVLTKIDGNEVALDGTIASEAGSGRIDFRSVVTQKVHGQGIHLHIVRDGELSEVDVSIGAHYEIVPRKWRGPRVQYIVFAGFVFVPLSYELLESCRVKKKTFGLTHEAETEVKHEYKWQHIVVVSDVLPHSINVNIASSLFYLKPLLSVNGVPIHHLADLADIIKQATATVATEAAVAAAAVEATATATTTTAVAEVDAAERQPIDADKIDTSKISSKTRLEVIASSSASGPASGPVPGSASGSAVGSDLEPDLGSSIDSGATLLAATADSNLGDKFAMASFPAGTPHNQQVVNGEEVAVAATAAAAAAAAMTGHKLGSATEAASDDVEDLDSKPASESSKPSGPPGSVASVGESMIAGASSSDSSDAAGSVMAIDTADVEVVEVLKADSDSDSHLSSSHSGGSQLDGGGMAGGGVGSAGTVDGSASKAGRPGEAGSAGSAGGSGVICSKAKTNVLGGKLWLHFQFARDVEVAFEADEALRATAELAEEHMLKSCCCVTPAAKV